MIAAATVLVLLMGPLCCAAFGLRRTGAAPVAPSAPWDWRRTLASALLCALAFNLIFLLQELFLVLPKALTPGLRATLYHNTHHWEGDNPLARLFQGTGALAILLAAVACALALERRTERSAMATLLLAWTAFQGFFQGLPQVVIGAVSPQNDVGMAMDYLGLSGAAKTSCALGALAALPLCAAWVTRHFLGLATQAELAGTRARNRFVFALVTLPALIAMPLIVPFRIPRELTEELGPPVVVDLIGALWMQALAWRVRSGPQHQPATVTLAAPLTALVALLALFQLVLRRGIAFY